MVKNKVIMAPETLKVSMRNIWWAQSVRLQPCVSQPENSLRSSTTRNFFPVEVSFILLHRWGGRQIARQTVIKSITVTSFRCRKSNRLEPWNRTYDRSRWRLHSPRCLSRLSGLGYWNVWLTVWTTGSTAPLNPHHTSHVPTTSSNNWVDAVRTLYNVVWTQ